MKKLTKLFEDAIKNNEQELQEILSEVEQASGKMSLEEKFRFIELFEEDNYEKAKDKRKEEVIKRGKYRVEIRTSTGTKIRTASSQKGLLDVIHGAKNFRVIDERSNKDVTTQIKKFIETRNKQGKSLDKKPKSTIKEDFNVREFTLRIERSKLLNEFRLGNLFSKPISKSIGNLDLDASNFLRTKADADPNLSLGYVMADDSNLTNQINSSVPVKSSQPIGSDSGVKPSLALSALATLGLGVAGAEMGASSEAAEENQSVLPPEYSSYQEDLTKASKLIGGIIRSKGGTNFEMETKNIGPIRDVTGVSEIM